MAKLEFNVPENLLQAFRNGEINALSFVDTVINTAKEGRNMILAQLVEYHNAGSAPHIERFDVINVGYEQAGKSGKLFISYDVNRFYGCSDLSTSEQDHEKWPFRIDTDKLKLIIDAPDFETLSPNEEF